MGKWRRAWWLRLYRAAVFVGVVLMTLGFFAFGEAVATMPQ